MNATAARTVTRRTVRDIMQPEVVSVRPDMTVRQLIQVLSDEGISGAPVLNEAGEIVGVVSATDVIQLAAHEAEIPSGQLSWEPVLVREEEAGDEEASYAYFAEPETPVRFTSPDADSAVEAGFDDYTVDDIMTPVAFTVRPSDPVGDVVQLLLRGRIHRALVVEDRMLLGIVTPFDVLRELGALLGTEE